MRQSKYTGLGLGGSYDLARLYLGHSEDSVDRSKDNIRNRCRPRNQKLVSSEHPVLSLCDNYTW